MKPKDCKTCRYAHLVKHTEHHKGHPDYLEGRCRIPMFARIVTKRNKEYCKDYEPRETAKMANHKHIPWEKAKQELLKSFKTWIDECPHTRIDTAKDMIEFLYQMGFIGGKKWRAYIDSVPEPPDFERWILYEPLREGMIPPDTLI